MQNRSMIGIGSKAKKLRDDRQRSAFAVAQAVKQMEALTWIGLAMGQGLKSIDNMGRNQYCATQPANMGLPIHAIGDQC